MGPLRFIRQKLILAVWLLLSSACPIATGAASVCSTAEPDYPAIDAAAADLVVAPEGDDDNDGSAASPLASLKRASHLADAGATVLIKGGIFRQRQVIERGGSVGRPVTYAAWPGERPIFDGADVQLKRNQGLVQVYASDVIVDGIEIRNSTSRGFAVYDADRVVLRRSHIHDIATKGYTGSGDELIIEGNVFDNLVMENVRGEGPRPWPAGIASWHRPSGERLSGWIVRDNEVSNVWGECIGLVFVDDAQVLSNRITDCYSVGLYLDNTRGVDVQRNVIRSSGDDFNRIDNDRAMVGINIAVEHYQSGRANATSDVLIANNLVLSVDRGIGFFNDPNNQSANNHYRDIAVAHNVVCDTEHAAVHFHESHPLAAEADRDESNLLVNNVLCDSRSGKGASLQLAEPSRWRVDANAWVTTVPDEAGAAHIELDSGFIDVSATTLADWKTDSASPLQRAGTVVAGATLDAFCTPRSPDRPAIGLYEHPQK